MAKRNLFQRCLGILEDHADTVIIIDEIDYAFKHESLLGAIRDIVDETLCIIILVGINTSGYKVLSKEGILKLGTFIQPDVLKKMRKESDLKPIQMMRKTAA